MIQQRGDPLAEQQMMADRLARAKTGELEALVKQYVMLSLAASGVDSIYHRWAAACERECINRGRYALYTGTVAKTRQHMVRAIK